MSIKFWAYFFLVLGISATHISGQVLRLVDGNNAAEGRVEISVFGVWKTVCDNGWDLQDAEVVCRMRGFEGASEAPGSAHFGQGTGGIAVADVGCTGIETKIFFCQYSLDTDNCDHSEDAGVVCTAPAGTEGAVRLVGGNNNAEGRVEIQYQEHNWGTICNSGWDINDAHVVCRMLGFQEASEASGDSYFGGGTGPIHLSSVACTGDEHTIFECGYAGFGISFCNGGHSQDVGVVCIAPASTGESDSSSSEESESSSSEESASSSSEESASSSSEESASSSSEESASSSSEESASSSSEESASSSSEESAESAASAESA